MVIFAAPDMAAALASFLPKFNALLEPGLPDTLTLQPNIVSTPNAGLALATGFTWLGPLSPTATHWLEKLTSLAPVVANTVKTTTPHALMMEGTNMIPQTVYPGKAIAISTASHQLSPSAIAAYAKHGALMPRSSTVVSLHLHHGYSVTNSETPCVFGCRQEHATLEIVGLATVAEGAGEAKSWAEGFAGEYKAAEGVLDWTYLPLTPRENVDLEKVYGEKYGRLLELKRKFDPSNVFRYSLPKLEI